MNMRSGLIVALVGSVVSLSLPGCSQSGCMKGVDCSTMASTSSTSFPSGNTGTMGEKSLYERLGGEPAITAVCNDFVARAASDPKVNFFRKEIPGAMEWKPTPEDLAMFKKHLVQFVCMAAGGPQQYEGRSMKSTHRGMKITESEFNALAADLAASLDTFNVPAKEKGELLGAVAATKKDIVERM